MIGRGGAKNARNCTKDGKARVGVNREVMGSKNLIQVERTHNFVPKLRTLANPSQMNELCESTPHKDVTLHEDEHPNLDMENQNMNNDSQSGFISSNEDIPAQLGKWKRTNKLNTRISKALEANVAVDQLIQRREELNAKNGRTTNRRSNNQAVGGNNGSSHSVVNEGTPQSGEATSNAKQRGERGNTKVT